VAVETQKVGGGRALRAEVRGRGLPHSQLWKNFENIGTYLSDLVHFGVKGAFETE